MLKCPHLERLICAKKKIFKNGTVKYICSRNDLAWIYKTEQVNTQNLIILITGLNEKMAAYRIYFGVQVNSILFY